MVDEIASGEETVQLVLPAQVICDWHADWTDLTDQADYSRFPMWHTKSGKEAANLALGGGGGGGGGTSTGASGASGSHHAGKGKKSSGGDNKNKDGTSKKNKQSRRESLFESWEGIHDKNPKASKVANRTRRSSSKVSSVIESVGGGGGLTGRRQSTVRVQSILGGPLVGAGNRRVSTSFKNLSPTMSYRVGSQMAGGGLLANNRPDLTNSRLITSQNSNSYSLNYQLSSKLFREKGWTVLAIDREETNHFNEKSIVTHLTNSLQSMYESSRFYCYFNCEFNLNYWNFNTLLFLYAETNANNTISCLDC